MTNASEPGLYRVNREGESTGPEGRYLVWTTSWGKMEVEPCGSLQEALESAREADDSEYGSFDCIEGPAGVVPDSDVEAWIRAKARAAAAARKAAAEADEGRTLFEVRLRHPNGHSSAEWDICKTEAAARDAAAEAGMAGRVQIKAADWRASTYGGYHTENQRVIMEYGEEKS